MLFSFVSCGQYNPPADVSGGENTPPEKEEQSGTQTPEQGGTAQRGEPFITTVTLNGKVYVHG